MDQLPFMAVKVANITTTFIGKGTPWTCNLKTKQHWSQAQALALAAEGVKLAISARRADKLQEVADEIVAAGGHRPVIILSLIHI